MHAAGLSFRGQYKHDCMFLHDGCYSPGGKLGGRQWFVELLLHRVASATDSQVSFTNIILNVTDYVRDW